MSPIADRRPACYRISRPHSNRYISHSWAKEHAANFSKSRSRIQDFIRALLLSHGWRIVWDLPLSRNTPCVLKYLRGSYHTPNTPERFNWTAMLHGMEHRNGRNCTQPTPFGPIANWDGELIADNPRLVDVGKGFSMGDKELKDDDLIGPLEIYPSARSKASQRAANHGLYIEQRTR